MGETFAEMETRYQAESEQAAERAYAHIAEDQAAARQAMYFNSGQWDLMASCTVVLNVRDQADVWDGVFNTDNDPGVARHIVRWKPPAILSYSASVSDALNDLEWIAERSPDPDSRMRARLAIHSLAAAWDPLETPETIQGELAPQALAAHTKGA